MIHIQEGSDLYVCAKFEANSSIRSKVMRGPKISKLGHIGLVLNFCTKFEAVRSIRSNVIRGSQISKLSHIITWPKPRRRRGHSLYGPHAGRIRPPDPSSISLPNLRRIAQFVQMLLRGPKIWMLGHVTPETPTYGSFIICTQGGSVLYVYAKFDHL